MKTAALLFGLLVLVLGVLGLLVPETYLMIGRGSATPVGLFAVALFRVAVGLVLIRAATGSRSPIGLRVLGALSFFAGLVTPLIGVDRARSYLDWWAAQGSGVMRAWALVAIAYGAFVVWAVTGTERAAIRRERPAV
ncbi:MAG: hypothetical protein KF764_22745 [Labilithrix sp.]|nr:hypothetical protein [Labilithrix sp.]MBX3223819.1 hypothetical protein [Labilithrix sp.]